jgi:hypothetical protein
LKTEGRAGGGGGGGGGERAVQFQRHVANASTVRGGSVGKCSVARAAGKEGAVAPTRKTVENKTEHVVYEK